MTTINKVKIHCHICGTEYEGFELMSWNSSMGKPDIPALVCPKCTAPAKLIRPEIHGGHATELLFAILEDHTQPVSLLCECSRNENDVDEWVKLMKAIDLKEIKKSTEESLKGAESNAFDLPIERKDFYVVLFKQNIEKLKKLQELSENGTLAETINNIASEAKESLKKERVEYETKIK